MNLWFKSLQTFQNIVLNFHHVIVFCYLWCGWEAFQVITCCRFCLIYVFQLFPMKIICCYLLLVTLYKDTLNGLHYKSGKKCPGYGLRYITQLGLLMGLLRKFTDHKLSHKLYNSGYRHYHAIHTQVIVENTGLDRHIECGFLGHQNDAQQYRLMDQIGGATLPFPLDCRLLADKIYPNRHPIVSPYTQQQITRKPRVVQNKYRKFNRIHSKYRSTVEHAIGEMKVYKILNGVWRHPRQILKKRYENNCRFNL